MDFKEAAKGLSPVEAEALKTLENCGWQIGLEVKIEDMRLPDGMRRRTFMNQGRYAVAAFLKNLVRREVAESPAFTPEIIAGMVEKTVEENKPEIGEVAKIEKVEEVEKTSPKIEKPAEPKIEPKRPIKRSGRR